MNAKSNKIYNIANSERINLFRINAEELANDLKLSYQRTNFMEKDIENLIKKTAVFEAKLDKLLIKFDK